MALLHRLSQTDLRRTKPGMYADGGGLWLQVTKSTAGHVNRSWIFRYRRRSGKRRDMGLGPVHITGLKDAREKAVALRKLVYDGIDPIEQRNAARTIQAAAVARTLSFDECAAAYAKAHSPKWTPKHATQWGVSLAKHASPSFGKLPVADVDTALVVKAIERIWHAKPETASRTRQRIEAVLDWATVRGYRNGENPARWNGYLQKLLPSRRELLPTEHFAATPYGEVPDLMATLREHSGVRERALEFLILTASRSAEARGARWEEISTKVWTIPGERMKSGKPHRVPLSPRALAILKEMQLVRRNEYVFPGTHRDSLTEHPMRDVLKRWGFATTVHGFRSSFRDWCREQTNFPRELAEGALAHVIGDQTERAYARGDMLEQRRRLMTAWADYCGRPAGEGATVTPLHGAHLNA
jgi:integrase